MGVVKEATGSRCRREGITLALTSFEIFLSVYFSQCSRRCLVRVLLRIFFPALITYRVATVPSYNPMKGTVSPIFIRILPDMKLAGRGNYTSQLGDFVFYCPARAVRRVTRYCAGQVTCEAVQVRQHRKQYQCYFLTSMFRRQATAYFLLPCHINAAGKAAFRFSSSS